MAKYGMKCGGQCADQAMQCPRCGAMLGMQNSGHVSQRPSGGGSQFSGGSFSPQNPSGGPGLAIASMVLGIVALVVSCCFYYLSIPCAIIGAILGFISLASGKKGKGMAIAGVVCSIVSLIPAILMIIYGASFFSAVSSLV